MKYGHVPVKNPCHSNIYIKSYRMLYFPCYLTYLYLHAYFNENSQTKVFPVNTSHLWKLVSIIIRICTRSTDMYLSTNYLFVSVTLQVARGMNFICKKYLIHIRTVSSKKYWQTDLQSVRVLIRILIIVRILLRFLRNLCKFEL